MHPHISDIERVVRRNRSPSHDRCHYRNIRLLCKRSELLIRMGDIDAAAYQEQRTLCLGQHFDGPFQLSDMYMGVRLISSDIHVFRIVCIPQFSHHVFGKVHQHRSRSSGPRDVKRLLDDPSQILPVADSDAIFRDAPGNAYDVNLLERIVSDQMSCHLS